MEGLIIMGLCFMLLALTWVLYLMPKASRERQDELMRHLRELEATRGDEPTNENVEQATKDE